MECSADIQIFVFPNENPFFAVNYFVDNSLKILMYLNLKSEQVILQLVKFL